jgi:hypothetical protein
MANHWLVKLALLAASPIQVSDKQTLHHLMALAKQWGSLNKQNFHKFSRQEFSLCITARPNSQKPTATIK